MIQHRRSFLQASSLALAGRFTELSASATRASGDSDPKRTLQVRKYWDDFPEFLTRVVNAARERRIKVLSELTTTTKIEARNTFVYRKVWELIGGTLDRTPLDVQRTGLVERGAYRIEKLLFASQPQFYVPAHFYIPNQGPGPFPCILAPLGHTHAGKLYRNYQLLFQNLARRGFAVFTWDPPGQGERLQFHAREGGASSWGPTREHDNFGFPALLLGSSATQIEVWDAVRALDYLVTRREVDAQRIGCCGHSGGGTMTMYLAALDQRIRAAVVVEGHTENVAGADYSPPGAYADAEQNIAWSLPFAVDRGDLLNCFAPKPLLICFTYLDAGSTYSAHYLAGTREIFEACRSVYSRFGAIDKVSLSASNLPHDYDFFHRRATYEWFHRWLGGRTIPGEAEFEEAPDSALLCTSSGQVLTSLPGRSVYQVNSDRLAAIQMSVRSRTRTAAEVARTLRELLGLENYASNVAGNLLSESSYSNLVIEELEIYSEAGIRVPGWFIKAASANSRMPVVLMVTDNKDEIFDNTALISDLARMHIAVCTIDVRGIGQCTPRLPASAPRFYSHGVDLAYALVSLTAGKPIAGQRTQDILGYVRYLAGRADVESGAIAIYGKGLRGLECVYAAVVEQGVRGVLLQNTLMELASIIRAQQYQVPASSFVPGLLKHFDVPELCDAIVPRPIWLLNPVGASGEPVAYDVALRRYQNRAHIYTTDDSSLVFRRWVEAVFTESRRDRDK